MNVNLVSFGLAVSCAAVFVGSVRAELKPLPTSSPPVYKPWIASENDVIGDWMDAGSKYWEITFDSDHTLNAYHGDPAGFGPYISTWKLVNNHIIITDTPALRKQGFDTDWGYDLLVMKVKNHVALLPIADLPLVQKFGLASSLCFWRSTKNGLDVLYDKSVDNRSIHEQLKREQNKQNSLRTVTTHA